MVFDPMNADIYIARSPQVAARMLGDEMMIVSSQQSALFTLNDTAATIWSAADGATPLKTIVEQHICAQFDIDPVEALRDAQALVAELEAFGVISVSDAPIREAS